jgi:hypothetical protein
MTTRIVVLPLVLGALLLIPPTVGFVLNRTNLKKNVCLKMSQEDAHAHAHPFCSLPGDPSLLLTTNVDLGDKKLEIMKGSLSVCRMYPIVIARFLILIAPPKISKRVPRPWQSTRESPNLILVRTYL